MTIQKKEPYIFEMAKEEIKPHISFETIDFHRLRVGVWKCPNPVGRPMLYFAGLGANIEMAMPWCGRMAHTRDIITFDVPGCGGSANPMVPYRPMWIARLGNRLLKRLGYDGKVDVFGVSWGGMIAQQYGLIFGSQVNKLILSASSQGTFTFPGNAKAVTKLASNERFTDPDYLMRNYEIFYGQKSAALERDHGIRLMPPTTTGYYFQLLAGAGWTSLPWLNRLKMPTLVLAGNRDRLVPLINSRIVAKLIPNSRLEIIKNGGHLFIITRANKVTRRVLDFLDNEPDDIRTAQKAER